MPHKIWAVGEEVLAADFQSYVQNQVVAVFADAAARTAGIAAPATGQLSWLLDLKRLDAWDGAAWVPVNPTHTDVARAAGTGGTSVSAAYVNLPVRLKIDAFTKQRAGTKLILAIGGAQVGHSSGLGTVQIGVLVGGVARDVVLQVGSTTFPNGETEVSGLAAGVYALEAQWKTPSGTLTQATSAVWTLRVTETY